jgi:hypothetical protein
MGHSGLATLGVSPWHEDPRDTEWAYWGGFVVARIARDSGSRLSGPNASAKGW